MPTIRIDGKTVETGHHDTLLMAAESLAISIPTLCSHPELPHFNSCMVCLVRDVKTQKLIPACSYPSEEGMEIDASSDTVRQARRHALDLLLREHFGDCEAPCRRGCPAGLDIPEMMRAVAAEDWNRAGQVLQEKIPIPGILGTICPAPCEKLCRRGDWDSALAICRMKYVVKQFTPPSAREHNLKPAGTRAPEAGRVGVPITVVGAGPAGLSAAWFLTRLGYNCRLIDQSSAPWSVLIDKVGKEKLNTADAESDYHAVMATGIDFEWGRQVRAASDLETLRRESRAVILAGGEEMAGLVQDWGVAPVAYSDEDSAGVSAANVFLCGALQRSCRLAARAVNEGRRTAMTVHQSFGGLDLQLSNEAFDSHAGALTEQQLANLAAMSPRPEKASRGTLLEASPAAAVDEARRCMSCDCGKKSQCKLRDYATDYGFKRVHAHPPAAEDIKLVIHDHPVIEFQPGKCIRCGLCVRLTEARDEPLGLVLTGRGRRTRLSVPLDGSFADAMRRCAEECVQICPTGALSRKP